MSNQLTDSSARNGHDHSADGARTYRGRRIEEILPQIRAELGPDAVILREREGLVGGINGFFAQRCFEIDARPGGPRVDVYDDDAEDLDTVEQRDPVDTADAGLDPVGLGEGPGPLETGNGLDGDDQPPAPVDASAPAAPAPGDDSFANHLQAASEAPEPPAPSTAPEPPIAPDAPTAKSAKAAKAARPSRAKIQSPIRGERRQTSALSAMRRKDSAPRELDGSVATALAGELVGQGVSDGWAQQLLANGAAHHNPFAPAGGLRAAVRASLAGALAPAQPLPVAGAAIAFIGAGGAGKTSCVAAMAAAYRRASTLPVTVIALGATDRGRELRDLLRPHGVRVDFFQRAHEAEQRVRKARAGGLVIVDTTAPAPGDGAAIPALAGELELLSPDATCITVAATLGAQTARRMLASLTPARPTAIALTHVDESDQLGVALELSSRSGLPIAYLHEGVDLSSSLSAPDPTLLARRLLR